MVFFGSKLVDEQVLEWQLDWYDWLIINYSTGAGLPDSELWLPIDAHFGHPDNIKLSGEALAQFVFERVKAQCGFGPETHFELRIIDTPKGGSLGGTAVVQTVGNTACGTYEIKDLGDGTYKETITITRDLIENPTQLIATLAHEIAHALHNRGKEKLEIEPELYELFTDLTTIYLGYGVFLANSRFEFSQFSDGNLQGWQAQGAGYLPEADMVMAMAIFMSIKNIGIEIGQASLKPRLAKMLDKAFKQLKSYQDDVEYLKRLDPRSGSEGL